MKRFLVVVSVAMLSTVAARAGPEGYSSEETAAAQPCPKWYGDREWNVSLWGTYAFTANDYPTVQNSVPGSLGFATHDTYLEADHAWGGGADAKFFFMRYFGIGVEGYALDVDQSFPDIFIDFFGLGSGRNFVRTSHDSRVIGSVLGTLTLRYPIGCSRFAPYVFAAGGAIFGGSQFTHVDTTSIGDVAFTSRSGARTRAVGQFGGGVEVRLTPHIGLTNDFTWNVVDGRDNNFGMVRTGLTFAF
jgi:hypothetical protein